MKLKSDPSWNTTTVTLFKNKTCSCRFGVQAFYLLWSLCVLFHSSSNHRKGSADFLHPCPRWHECVVARLSDKCAYLGCLTPPMFFSHLRTEKVGSSEICALVEQPLWHWPHCITESTQGQFHSQAKDTKASSTDRSRRATAGQSGEEHSWHTWICVVQKDIHFSSPLSLRHSAALCFLPKLRFFIHNWHFRWLSLIKHL